ncbi:hypothetical protein [Candidatus Kuenenia sp.]|uniref:hypothetical protein n=1 Tax=Candidatus Kuenenia sp. TaxID=2499824 RepID=UPI00321FF73F
MTIISEVYDAFKEAGVSEEKARAAASAIADFSGRFDRIDSELKDLKGEIKNTRTDLEADIKILRAEINVIKWMIGFVIAGIIGMLIKAFAG